MNKLKIGFIGLGLMGNQMAKNILKNNFELSVYNRTISKTKELERMGAKVFKTPKKLADNSDMIITMVTGPKDVNEVLFGNNGVTKSTNRNLVIIDMSTIGPSAAKEISKKLKSYKIDFLDAPVTGSTPAAKSGDLTIFVGGNKKLFEKSKPVFYVMGKSVLYVGPTGSGQAIKLINNLIVGITTAAIAEAMLLADVEGLSRGKVAEFLDNSPIMSRYIGMKMKNMINNNYQALFSVRNINKDLNLALFESSNSKIHLPTLDKVSKIFEKSIKCGLGEEDLSAVIKYIEKNKKK